MTPVTEPGRVRSADRFGPVTVNGAVRTADPTGSLARTFFDRMPEYKAR